MKLNKLSIFILVLTFAISLILLYNLTIVPHDGLTLSKLFLAVFGFPWIFLEHIRVPLFIGIGLDGNQTGHYSLIENIASLLFQFLYFYINIWILIHLVNNKK